MSDARTERDRIRKLVRQGIDPVAERRHSRSGSDTFFATIATKWMKAQRGEWSQRNYDILQRRLERLIYPKLGSRDIRTIRPIELLEVVRQIEDAGAKELPARMNGVCGRIFRFAQAEGWDVQDPSLAIREALKRQGPKVNRAFIRPNGIGKFLHQLLEPSIVEVDTAEAILLGILCASRSAEIRFAERSEFEALDSHEPLWRVPADRMKMRREHVVPLSSQAAAIVRKRIERLPASKTHLFWRPTRSGAISENTMLYALYRLGYHSRATMHGFRRTFSTWANEARDAEGRPSWPPEWIEWALAHVQKDKVRAAYNAAEYLTDRRRLLQAWADWLDISVQRAEQEQATI